MGLYVNTLIVKWDLRVALFLFTLLVEDQVS
jgi:hypothetical protein